MSIIGKIARYVPQKKNEEKTSSKDVVFPYEKKIVTKFTVYLPWSYYVKRYLWIDQETKIEECIVIQKNGSIQQTYAFRGQDIESFSYDYVARIFDYFNSQIKRLEDGWMVSVEAQRFRMHDYPSADFESVAALLVDKEREKDFKETGEHYDSCYFLNFVYKPENEIKSKISRIFWKEVERNYLIEEEIKKFQKTVEGITSVLAGRMVIRPLSCKETVEYLHSTCSTIRHEFILPENTSFLFLDTFISDCKVEIGKTLRIGNKYCPIIEINDFPTNTYPAILNKLNALEIEYRWVSRYFPLGKEQSLKELVTYQQQAAASKSSTKQLATEMALGVKDNLENHAGVAAQNEAEMAQEEIGADINGMGYYNSCVMVWDEDYFKALEKADQICAEIRKCGFGCKEEEFGTFDAMLGMCAGNVTNDVRRPLITTGNYSHTLPFSAIWAGMEYNRHLGELCGCDKPLITCATNFGAVHYLNLNDGDVGHTLIIGPSGGGKSTLLNLIAISSQKYPGVQVFFMDYGISSLTLTLAMGGTYINPADSTVCFQPLENIDDPTEFQWAINFIITIIEIQGIKVNATMKVAITSAMEGVREYGKEMRTLTTLCLNLQYVDEKGHKVLHDALSNYTIDGRYGKIFDGNKTSLGKDRWVLFEMEPVMKLGEDCSAPALLFIFHYLESKFDGRLTFFIMDECWFGLQNPAIASKMEEYLRTLRKKNVFCIFATQDPHSVANSSLASVMIQNCPTHIFLADPSAREEAMANDYVKLGLKNHEIELLSNSIKKMDYYIKCPSGTRKFQLNLGPLQLALFRGAFSKYQTGNGKIVNWKDVLDYLNDCAIKEGKEGKKKAQVDKILDLQNIEFRSYLKGLKWKEYL